MISPLKFAAGIVLAASLSVAACHGPSTSGRVYVSTAPPPIVVERPGPSPGQGWVWVPGFYRWNGRQYFWVNGRWERPPRPHQRWVAGKWVQDRHQGWFWVDGHWS